MASQKYQCGRCGRKYTKPTASKNVIRTIKSGTCPTCTTALKNWDVRWKRRAKNNYNPKKRGR